MWAGAAALIIQLFAWLFTKGETRHEITSTVGDGPPPVADAVPDLPDFDGVQPPQ